MPETTAHMALETHLRSSDPERWRTIELEGDAAGVLFEHVGSRLEFACHGRCMNTERRLDLIRADQPDAEVVPGREVVSRAGRSHQVWIGVITAELLRRKRI